MKDQKATTQHLNVHQSTLQLQQVHTEGALASPTLVFLHDALGSIAQWKGFPEKLAQACGLNAVVYDRAGHGGSGPLSHERNEAYLHREALEILPELLRQLRIDKPILIGHSDGGTIALIYAAYHDPAAIITEAAHAFVEEATRNGIRRALSRKAELVEKLSIYHGDKTEALFDAWADTWLNPDFANWSMEGLLPRITCPALVIQGTEDGYGTDEQVRRIVKGIGDRAEAFRVEGCGHIPHRQAEEEVLERMAAFIGKHSSAGNSPAE